MLKKFQSIIEKRIDRLLNKFNDKSALVLQCYFSI